MIFRPVVALFAVSFLGISLMARAQSSPGEESILFTAPDGQSVSNALLPSASAPQPPEPRDLSSAVSTLNLAPAYPGPRLEQPAPVFVPRSRSHSDKTTDIRTEMGVPTEAEIMGVPTVRGIFGLPDSDQSNAKKNPALLNANTNTMGQIFGDDLAWTKILSSDGNDDGNSGKATNSTGLFSGLFSSAPDDDVYGIRDKIAEDSVFRSSFSQPARFSKQPAQHFTASSPSPSPSLSRMVTSPKAFGVPQNNFSLDSVFKSDLSSFSASDSTAMGMTPQLPELPNVSRQDDDSLGRPITSSWNRNEKPRRRPGEYDGSSQATTPTWEPGLPPWLSSGPQMGVMPQRKF